MVDHFEDILLGRPDVFWMGDGLDPDLSEAVSQGGRELFFSVVATGIHGSNDAEAWLGLDCFPAITTLYPHQSTFQYLVQSLQDTVFSSVYLIYQQNSALEHGLDYHSIHELELGI